MSKKKKDKNPLEALDGAEVEETEEQAEEKPHTATGVAHESHVPCPTCGQMYSPDDDKSPTTVGFEPPPKESAEKSDVDLAVVVE